MNGLVGAVAVPTAPVVLPAATPGPPAEVDAEVARLRRLAERAVELLPPADAHVLVAAAPSGEGESGHAEKAGAIHHQTTASLRSLGVPRTEVELPVAETVIGHLSRLTQYPLRRDRTLSVAHSVLALQVHAAHGRVPVVAVSVPAETDFDALVSVGAAVEESAADAGLGVAVVCAGDLSARGDETGPDGRMTATGSWDEQAVAAARNRDLDALRQLGPDAAGRVGATGWAPLAVFHGACAAAGLDIRLVAYLVVDGVGQLVVAADPGGRPGGLFDVDGGAAGRLDGVVPRTGDPRG